MSTNLNTSLETLFGKMENFVSTKTVVGEAIHIGDIIIVPLVDVIFGVGATDVEKEKESKGTSGGAMGGKITPSAVLVIIEGRVQLVNIKNQDSINKLIDMVPGIASKFNLGSLFGKKEEKKDEEEDKDIYNDAHEIITE